MYDLYGVDACKDRQTRLFQTELKKFRDEDQNSTIDQYLLDEEDYNLSAELSLLQANISTYNKSRIPDFRLWTAQKQNQLAFGNDEEQLCNQTAYQEFQSFVDSYGTDLTAMQTALREYSSDAGDIRATQTALSRARSALSSAVKTLDQNEYTKLDAQAASEYATATTESSLDRLRQKADQAATTYDNQLAKIGDLETAVSDAKDAYLRACPANVMTKNLYPGYRSWVTNYLSYEKTVGAELQGMRYTAPKNPSQSIIDLFKRYIPDNNESAVVSRIQRSSTTSIAYAFYSYIEET